MPEGILATGLEHTPELIGGTTAPKGDGTLGFSLNFLSGHGLLSVKNREFGPFQVTTLELEIPEISFPFDVTGGAQRFKTLRCSLRHLVFGMTTQGLNDAIKSSPLVDAG